MPSNIITPFARNALDCTVLNATYEIGLTPQPGFVLCVQASLSSVLGLTAVPTVSFGTGAGADWDDIVPDTVLTGLNTNDEMWTFQLTNGTSIKPSGNASLRMKVQAAATATVYYLDVVIYFVEAPFGGF